MPRTGGGTQPAGMARVAGPAGLPLVRCLPRSSGRGRWMRRELRGGAQTRRQILIYSALVTPLGVVPAFTGLGGAAYLAVSGLGGLVFMLLAVRLFRSHAGESPDPRMDDGLYDVRAG